jgi:hypothetical protein
LLAGKGKQLASDCSTALGGPQHPFERIAHFFVGRAAASQIQIAKYYLEEIVEGVGASSGQPSYCLELLRLPQHLLETVAFCQVTNKRTEEWSVADRDGCDRQFHWKFVAIPMQRRQLYPAVEDALFTRLDKTP